MSVAVGTGVWLLAGVKVKVAVGLGVWLGSSVDVAVPVGGGVKVAVSVGVDVSVMNVAWLLANSEVLPLGSVAVMLIDSPSATACINEISKSATPLASVVTLVNPR